MTASTASSPPGPPPGWIRLSGHPGYGYVDAPTAPGDEATRMIVDAAGAELGLVHYRRIRLPAGGSRYGWTASARGTALSSLNEAAGAVLRRSAPLLREPLSGL